jgi:polyhydroxyalkanoate synthesis regulator phasin
MPENPAQSAENAGRAPDPLVQKLHDATENFHEQRKKLEDAMDDADYDHQKHVSQCENELQAAEKELEEVNDQIRKSLDAP